NNDGSFRMFSNTGPTRRGATSRSIIELSVRVSLSLKPWSGSILRILKKAMVFNLSRGVRSHLAFLPDAPAASLRAVRPDGARPIRAQAPVRGGVRTTEYREKCRLR